MPTTPYYELHLFLCTNERPAGHPRGSCAAQGSVELRDAMKKRALELGLTGPGAPRRVRLQQCGCLDRCEKGPVAVVYPEGTWYGVRTVEDMEEILTSHVRDGQPVERLLLD